MKNTEIKELSEQELVEKIQSEKEAMQRLKFAHAISAIENPMKIRATRRLIAQLKTELRAREIAKPNEVATN
jgi:large subunit ribosomal protein L29